MRLLLVRHGQTPANVDHVLDTALPGPALTALGHEQAGALVGALAGEHLDAVWASAATRARLTAAPLAAARGLPVRVREGVREVEAGPLEGRSDEEAARAYLRTAFAWARGDRSAALPGAEDGHAFLARYDGVVAEVAADLGATGGSAALVVSHGAAIRVWAAARTPEPGVDWISGRPLANTAVVVVEGDPRSSWRVAAWDGAPVAGAGTAAGLGPAAEPER